MKHINNPTT